MRMRNIIGCFLLGTVLLTTSCEDFTELQPKGKNLLATTDELEMLLNIEHYFVPRDWTNICGDMIYGTSNVPTMISQPTKTRNVIMWTWDEANQNKMAELTSSDVDYTNFYGIIGRISNPILSRVDDIEGDEAVKAKLKCEALVLRAYYHYLLVNKYAKAYNPASAESDLGIPYMTEKQDILQQPTKVTVQEVYDHILNDLDMAIELDALPVVATNRMRMSKPCAYAAKALALISMQQFDAAGEAAKQALALNSEVDNYNEMLTTLTGRMLGKEWPVILRPTLECKEDLFYTHYLEYMGGICAESWNAFEEGHACKEKMSTDLFTYDYVTGLGKLITGLPTYTYTFDMTSGWNGFGMKTTQMYLIVAESEIHKQNYDAAMQALDAIRVNRIDPAVYMPLAGMVTTKDDAISHLKQTSHGENIYSCHNFINRKRWNQVEGYKQTISREIGGQVYQLSPDSPMWIFPFPMDVVSLNPNLTQNYKETNL